MDGTSEVTYKLPLLECVGRSVVMLGLSSDIGFSACVRLLRATSRHLGLYRPMSAATGIGGLVFISIWPINIDVVGKIRAVVIAPSNGYGCMVYHAMIAKPRTMGECAITMHA